MKRIICLITFIINVCNAGEPPVQQTLLTPTFPSITSNLLAVHAQLIPQTKPYRETREEEIARLEKQNKAKEEEIKQLMIRIRSLELSLTDKEKENENLRESLHHVTHISTHQKNKLEEQAQLLDIATREIVALQTAQEEQKRRIEKVISNGYKKLEQIKASQKERGIIT